MHTKYFKNPFRLTRGIFCFCLFLFSSAMHAQAKAEWKTTKIDFERVKRGEVLHLDFIVTNTGNQPLLLKDDEVSCGCTTVDYSTKPILPGQSSTVTVNFDTKTVYGRQERIVKLYTNAAEKPVNLKYKGYAIYDK